MAKIEKTNNDLENYRSSNTNTIKNWGWTQVIWNGKQFLLHMWHLMCYSC